MTDFAARSTADLPSIRRDYRTEGIDPDELGDDPFAAFEQWFDDETVNFGDDANAVVLATSDAVSGRPSARTVLLRGVSAGRFLFYTNYNSRKARELADNPQAMLLFSWVLVSRQLAIEGTVEKVDAATSDAYFASRPHNSQIGAWASDQSAPIPDRVQLEARYAAYDERFADVDVPRPDHWGGFALRPDRFEFWQGRPDRLHDRFEFRLVADTNEWARRRLGP